MKLLSTIIVTLFAALPFVAMASLLEDSYGCNPSTGYTWCSKLQRCARSYECYPSLENAFMNYLTDMNENDEDSIDDGEEEDTIIETYTEGNPREGNLHG